MIRLSPVQLDRAAGVLIGSAAGDALGAGYEFTTPGPSHAEMVGGGPFGWAAGQWTDDTQMAICIAEETATGGLDPLAVGQRFLDWFATDPPDVGNQTRASLSAAGSASELAGVAADVFARRPSRSGGNGSLMRTAPVALNALGDDAALVERAATVSMLTHGDPVAAEACVIWCVAIDRAVREGRLDGWWDGADLLEPSSRVRWRSLLDDAESKPPETFRPNGYVVTALQAAVSAIVTTPIRSATPCVHLQDALRRAVSIGDDTDTVAAIAGAVLGGRWGASAVPFAWRRLLHGWPGYQAHDLGRLAVLSALGGASDSMGWPSAPTLAEVYDARTRPSGVKVALADDSGVVLGDVAALRTIEGEAILASAFDGERSLQAPLVELP